MTRSERAWQAVADAGAAVMRLVPRGARYPLALAISRMFSGVVGPLLMKRPDRYRWSTLLDETMRSALRAMSRRGMEFDPTPKLDVPEDLAQTVRVQGAIVVGAHFPLNALVTRYLHDHGYRPAVVLGSPEGNRYIWGTSQRIDLVMPSQTILLTLREWLRERRVVVMVLDRCNTENRTETVDTAVGTIAVATPIFDFARRLDVPVYWMCARTDAVGSPVVHLKRIEPRLEDFAAQFREHVDALRR